MMETVMSEKVEVTRRIPNRVIDFLSIPEVAKARGVSRVAVLYDIRTGKLRACRAPGSKRWMIHVDDVRAYLETPVRGRSSAS
jgi:excisionase family DNA binding protein